jgi:hypothetical protein
MQKPSTPHEEIMHCITESIFPGVTRATQHLEVYKLIGSYKSQLDVMENKERQYLYFYLQQSALRLMILEIAKLYDAYSSKYETLSINYLFKKLEIFKPKANWNRFFSVKQSQLQKCLLDKALLKKLEAFKEAEFPEGFKKLKPELNEELKADLDTLKTLRDKHVAHTDKVAFGTTIQTNTIQSLIAYALDIAQAFCIMYNTGAISWSHQSVSAFFVQKLLDEDFGM